MKVKKVVKKVVSKKIVKEERVAPVNSLAVHRKVMENMEQVKKDLVVTEITIPLSLYHAMTDEIVDMRNRLYALYQRNLPLPFKFDCECGRSYMIGQ